MSSKRVALGEWDEQMSLPVDVGPAILVVWLDFELASVQGSRNRKLEPR